jgi:cytochrome b561
MRAEPSLGWTKAQRRLHWWTAVLVLLVFPLGWLMVGVPLSQLLLKFLLYQLHKTLGILAFALAVTRLLVRARRGRPGWDEGIPGWQRQAAGAVHALLYAVLLATPALGYLTAATAPIGIPTLFLGVIPIPHLVSPDPAWFSVVRQIHRSMAILLVVLAGGHAAASIHNHLRGRGTLVRMWRDQDVRHPHPPNS